MSRAEHQWTQFRRLLLGTVLEVLLDQGAALDATTLSIAFDPRSRFQVPRFDNYMRFSGSFQADVLAPLEPAAAGRVERGLVDAWMGILKSIELPVGDKLTNTKAEVRVSLGGPEGTRLTVAFDLEAD